MESVSRSDYRNLLPIVVDNASGADAMAVLRDGLEPTIPIIESDDNLGYGAGNNLGIRRALEWGAELVWVLNPDTLVEPDTLRRLVEAAFCNPAAGIVGSRIFYGGSKPAKIWYDGGIIDWSRGGATAHARMGKLDRDVPDAAVARTDYVTGCSMLVRREVFEDVGLIPEHYFLYYEETDFNVRAQRQGWHTIVAPKSKLWHFRRSQGALPSPYYVYYLIRNRLVFASAFCDASADDVVDDLAGFINGWRVKVEKNDRTWLDTFDWLVAEGIADGRAGRTGRRMDIAEAGVRSGRN
jgi:GT2 family glycosyltransferase